MAATNGTRTETLSGLVEATNDKGIKVGPGSRAGHRGPSDSHNATGRPEGCG